MKLLHTFFIGSQGPQVRLYRLGQLISLIYGRGDSRPSKRYIVRFLQRQLGLVQDYSSSIIVSSFLPAMFHIIRLFIHMREVSCVRYTARAWDPRSLQPMLNDFVYFVMFSRRLKTALRLVYNDDNSNNNIFNSMDSYVHM